MKTFRQLLNECDFQKVLEILKNRSNADAIKNVNKFEEGYTYVSSILKNLPQKEISTNILSVYRVEKDPLNEGKSWDGAVEIKDNQGETWASDFQPWDDLIDTRVETKYSTEEAVAYLLYDVTFYGFDKEGVDEKFEEMKKGAAEASKEFDADLERIDRFTKHVEGMDSSVVEKMTDEELDDLFDNFDKS